MKNDKSLLRVNEFAALLDVTPACVRRWLLSDLWSPAFARRGPRGDELDLAAGAESEIQPIIEDGLAKWRAAKAQANPHGHVTIADDADMRRCISEYERAKRGLPLEAGKQHSSAVEWNVFTYLDAQQSQIIQPPWKIRGLVVEGGASQVSAHPHGMKSLSWLNAALESVTLHTVWRHFDASNVQRVLYIESEDPQWLVEQRIRGIAKGLGLDPNADQPGFHYICPGPFDLVREEELLRELFAKYQPDYVVLSTLQNLLAGRDWISQKEMQPVNALIVRLSRACPLVVLTHSPWDSEKRRAAGTITQFANFAVTMHYQKVMPGRDTKAGIAKKHRSKSKSDEAKSEPPQVDPNDPRLVSEILDVNLDGDAYASYQKRGGDTIHIVVDSKMGTTVGDFHLKLETEGDEVRGLVYGGEGWPKGAGKEAVLEAMAAAPEASAEEIAKSAGVSDRYVRQIKAKSTKKVRGKAKRKAVAD
jgi:hypothetical protein